MLSWLRVAVWHQYDWNVLSHWQNANETWHFLHSPNAVRRPNARKPLIVTFVYSATLTEVVWCLRNGPNSLRAYASARRTCVSAFLHKRKKSAPWSERKKEKERKKEGKKETTLWLRLLLRIRMARSRPPHLLQVTCSTSLWTAFSDCGKRDCSVTKRPPLFIDLKKKKKKKIKRKKDLVWSQSFWNRTHCFRPENVTNCASSSRDRTQLTGGRILPNSFGRQINVDDYALSLQELLHAQSV